VKVTKNPLKARLTARRSRASASKWLPDLCLCLHLVCVCVCVCVCICICCVCVRACVRVCTRAWVRACVRACVKTCVHFAKMCSLDSSKALVWQKSYEVATISRLLKITGLFCRISSLLYGSFAKGPIIVRSLLIVATPYLLVASGCCSKWRPVNLLSLHVVFEGVFGHGI